MKHKLVDVTLPNGEKAQIEIVHLDELLRRGIRDAQGSVLYWEGEGNNRAAADAMRAVRTDGEKVRTFLKPHI